MKTSENSIVNFFFFLPSNKLSYTLICSREKKDRLEGKKKILVKGMEFINKKKYMRGGSRVTW